MKLSIELVSIILFTLIFLPLIYFIWQGPKNVNFKKKQFKSKAQDLDIKTEDIHIFGKLIVGIDRKKNVLCYCNDSFLWSNMERVNLNQVSTCALKTTRDKKSHLDWVSLEIIEGESLKSIVFYNENDDSLAYPNPMEALFQAEKCKKNFIVMA